MSILETALQLAAAGASIVPVAADGTKRPAVAWKQYTRERADQHQIHAWFDTNPDLGVGVITGAVSGNLEMLEFEGRAMDQIGYLRDLADGTGIGPLLTRIEQGWLEQSPSGGLHWFYRVQGDVPGNTKLAQGPDHVTLAETRGEGGFVVVAPSGGTVHPSGKPYVLLLGGPDTIATITLDEREALHTVFTAALDQTPDPEPNEPATGPLASRWTTQQPGTDEDVKPGDDYEAKTDWADILTPHGWTLVHTAGQTRYWRRPGKGIGISATTGHAQDRDRLYVFTTSTELPSLKPITKFGAYTLLEHGGDYAAAASALHAAGYGRRAPRPLTPATNASERTAPPNQAPRPTLTVLPGGNAQPATATTGEDDDLTDTGNARLAEAEYRNRLQYVPDAGKWAAWDGTRWTWAPDQAPAIQACLDIADRLPDVDKQTHAHRLKSLSARSISNAAAILKTMPDMRTPADTFDHQPYQLNTPAGIVDLHTGSLLDPTPHLWHTKTTGVTYQPNTPTPAWDAFLEQTFEGDQAMAHYVQQLVGLSLIGEVLENILPFLHGAGGNGKSVFLDTIAGILGDYAQSAPANFLMAGRDQHPAELAKLRGARFVIASEINEGSRFDEAKMKLLTGGDTISARFMRQDFFEFTPSHTLWLMGNSQPKVETGGESFWRRLRLIPFTHTVTKKQRVEGLAKILVEREGGGILAWAVHGAVDYLNNGLTEPDAVHAATSQYKAEEDHLGRYAADHLHIGGGDPARVLKSELRADYINWCETNGERALNGTAFGRQLKQRLPDLGEARSHGKHYFTNLTLLNGDSLDGLNDPWRTR